MVVCKSSVICLILVFCANQVRCETTGRNHCGAQVPCDDGSQCIERGGWCDLYPDCADKSDEKYCKTKGFFDFRTPDNKCEAGRHFTCEDGMCIPQVLMCDGYEDCRDNSDEKDCGSSVTVATTGQSSLSNSSTESSPHLLSTEVPVYSPITEIFNGVRPVQQPTVSYYDNRRAQEEVTQRPPYNPLGATAPAAYPPIHHPDPTTDHGIYPDSPSGRDQRSFDNFDRRQPWPEHTTAHPPTREPCDKTMTRSDDDDETSLYRVPWPRFVFESSHGDQIKNQFYYNARSAQEWLLAQRDAKFIWGENTPRALVALSLSSDANSNLAAVDILQRRLRIDLGARLIRRREGTRSLSTSELALYINALIATCQNPRNFFGWDLVEMLYDEVQGKRVTDASPFPYLTLCLADRPLTADDRTFLFDVVGREVTDDISKDKFILATSALACLKKTNQRDRELDRSVDDASHKLQQQQLDDGSFGSVHSTALAAQALIAIDSRSWNQQSTMNYLSSKQRDDGSFGDFLATYYALPVLNGKSLLHLRNILCPNVKGPTPTPTPPPPPTPPPTPPSRTKHVRYALATEKPYIRIATLELEVPVESNFFDIMKRAQEIDRRFRFLHVEHDGKIDVYQINGIPNDPEFGMFWILYVIDGRGGQVTSQYRYAEDIRNLIPRDSDELLFYYVQFKPGY